MNTDYQPDHSIHSISAEEELPSDNLLYFYFDDDDLQSENMTSFPLSGQGLSKLLEMIRYHQNLNITSTGHDFQQQEPTGTAVNRTPNRLQAMIELIILALKPERIYQVNYPASTAGDIDQITDLLIIIPDSCQQPFSKMEPLLELAKLQQQEVFCTLMKSEKLLEVLEKGDLYFSLGCTADNLVYTNQCSDQKALPVLNMERLNYLKAHAKLNFYSHLAKAKKFLNAAKHLKDDSGDGICLFMLHQATEVTLRGIILAFTGMDKRTHELGVLIKHASRFCPAINAILSARTEEEKYLLHTFDEGYFKSRYNPEYSPERHLEALLLPKVEQVQQLARESFEIMIARLEARG